MFEDDEEPDLNYEDFSPDNPPSELIEQKTVKLVFEVEFDVYKYKPVRRHQEYLDYLGLTGIRMKVEKNYVQGHTVTGILILLSNYAGRVLDPHRVFICDNPDELDIDLTDLFTKS